MEKTNAEELYSLLKKPWPDSSHWYDYTQKIIEKFIMHNLAAKLSSEGIYLNAGSGGKIYNLQGTCYHVDVAGNLITNLPNSCVASVESLPFEASYFDAAICVGSVLNYCDIFGAVNELQRILKPNGYLIIELERSNTAELWLSKEYGNKSSLQSYRYLCQQHTLWLYSEKYVCQILKTYSLKIIKIKRFHNLSALINRITNKEEIAGRFAICDPIFKPLSYFMAHNVILFCQKK